MVKLRGITKSYAGRTVLDIPALTLPAGGRVAVIGPNGSGKSTLLRIISGVLAPDAGSVALDDDAKENLGYMPQQPYSFDVSVAKNVLMALDKGPAAKADALKALGAVGMAEMAEMRGSRLSGGEAQRMALARMLAKRRRLLVLDEPTAATDIAGTKTVEDALLRYCEENTCTLVFSTHSPAQAGRLATTVLMLHGGSLIESGEAQSLLETPQNPTTAEFLAYW